LEALVLVVLDPSTVELMKRMLERMMAEGEVVAAVVEEKDEV
jgi:hypothetical protein